jgi:membrane protein implicated in regulation of membrane protease activity
LTIDARIAAYIEIGVVSFVSLIYAIGLFAIAVRKWKTVTGLDFEWQSALFVRVIGMLPYLVIAAVVWRVNLSAFGNRASSEVIPEAGKILEPVKGTLDD